ncbi:MAG TPA: hypothetical protein VF808_03305 [Ktedonobacterales bacterium]
MISGVFAKPGQGRAGRAITDVYDISDRRVLVRFPTALVSILAVTGVIAFGLVGYLGYNSDPSIVKSLFAKAWPIFLWFSALVFTLEIAVLRHPRLRRQLVQALVMTIIAMIFVGVTAVFPDAVTQLLSNLLNIHIYIPDIGKSPWTYAILNFGIILVFWLDTLRRWLRSRGGSSSARVLDLGIGTLEFGEEGDLPTLPELVAGDLIAAGVLVSLLALVLQANVLGPVASALQTGVQITTCTLSWPIGYCAQGFANNPPTLFRIDIIQALIYLPLGFITLALTATTNAFSAASDTDQQQASAGVGSAVAVPGTDAGQALSTDVRSSSADLPSGERGSARVRTTVIDTIYEALRAPLQRRIRLVIDNLLLALRNVVWPVFIFLGMFALGLSSKSIAFYLRTQSNQRNCAEGLSSVVGGAQSCAQVASQIKVGLQYGNLAEGVGLVIAAAAAIVIALMMLVFTLRVAGNTVRFLAVVGWVAALTLWLFSLSLSVSNQLFILVGVTQRQPFPMFGASTTLSLLVFLVASLFLVIGRARAAQRRAALAGVK